MTGTHPDRCGVWRRAVFATVALALWTGAAAAQIKITEPTHVDCAGGSIGDGRGDAISIVGAGASGTVVENCTVIGAIRLYGLGRNGQEVRDSSRLAEHTARAQAAAPRGVVLRNLDIRGTGRVPVYFAPGVTESTLEGSAITGTSNSSVVYLDAESAGNTIRGNVFRVRTPREILSVDGSARNTIEANTFHHADRGGVFVYRNCGEGGAARHQEPRGNVIRGNRFLYDGRMLSRPTIWLSFKTVWRRAFYCPLDRSIPYGSGADNRNFARDNIVTGNVFETTRRAWPVRDWGRDNVVFGNASIRMTREAAAPSGGPPGPAKPHRVRPATDPPGADFRRQEDRVRGDG